MDDHDQLSTQEADLQLFTTYSREGEQRALDTIAEKFEDASKPLDRLYFHDTDHTKGLFVRGERLVDAFSREGVLVPAKDRALMRLGCAYHDVVQNYTMDDITITADGEEFSFQKRKRDVGNNERASAAMAVAYMQECNDKAGKEIYSARDMFVVKAGIESTEPTFVQTAVTTDVGDKTIFAVSQNKLNDYIKLYKDQTEIPELGRALDISDMAIISSIAIADLGTAGMEGAEAAMIDGDKLLLEDYPILGQEIMNDQRVIPEKFRSHFIKMIKTWGDIQIDFPVGLRTNLTKELAQVSPGIAKALDTELSRTNYDESSTMSSAIRGLRETMDWDELVVDMRGIVNTRSYSLAV